MSTSPHRPPAEAAALRPGLPLVALATLAVLVTAADTYVVVLALPDILPGVGVGIDELQRATPIIGGFLLGYTATLPLLGRLADLRGRLPVLVGCLLLFALGSLLTATAGSLGPAVTGRALQGIGAGGLVPATLALVADRWPPERRSLPLGVVGAVQEAGAVLGPLAGAAVLAVADWRAIFWLNLLLGLGLAAGVAGLGPRRPHPGGPAPAAPTRGAGGPQLGAPPPPAPGVAPRPPYGRRGAPAAGRARRSGRGRDPRPPVRARRPVAGCHDAAAAGRPPGRGGARRPQPRRPGGRRPAAPRAAAAGPGGRR